METICIITDGTVQFSLPSFPGRDKIQILPFTIRNNNELLNANNAEAFGSFPSSAKSNCRPIVQDYDRGQITDVLTNASQTYRNVLIILTSSNISPLMGLVQEILTTTIKGRNIHIIDSQTTSAGLGFLVQKAADMANSGASIFQIEGLIRQAVHQVYALLAIPSPSYLFYSGFIDRAQADVCELMGLIPLFHLEDGSLIPVQKIRNLRTLPENMLEFLEEFDRVSSLTLIHLTPGEFPELRQIHNSVNNFSGKATFSEQPPSLLHAAVFGPKALSLFAFEEG
jgi:DegV family protein with EDD domain